VAKTIRSSKNPADYKSLHLQKFTKRKAGVLTPSGRFVRASLTKLGRIAAGEAAKLRLFKNLPIYARRRTYALSQIA